MIRIVPFKGIHIIYLDLYSIHTCIPPAKKFTQLRAMSLYCNYIWGVTMDVNWVLYIKVGSFINDKQFHRFIDIYLILFKKINGRRNYMQ